MPRSRGPRNSLRIRRRGALGLPRYSERVPDAGNHLSCSFCGKSQKQVKKLIAGPSAYICDGCMRRVHTVLAAPGRTASTPIARIQQVGDEPGAGQCSFCGKARDRVAAMASAGTTRICNECLALCDEIVREEPEEQKPPPDTPKVDTRGCDCCQNRCHAHGQLRTPDDRPGISAQQPATPGQSWTTCLSLRMRCSSYCATRSALPRTKALQAGDPSQQCNVPGARRPWTPAPGD